MVKLILLLLLFRIDNSSTVVDTFDRIEVNHHYNEWGAEVWTQLAQIVTGKQKDI